ncbi:hypothetical protein ACHQM5_027438 [Ranunculus cassubicifolius]
MSSMILRRAALRFSRVYHPKPVSHRPSSPMVSPHFNGRNISAKSCLLHRFSTSAAAIEEPSCDESLVKAIQSEIQKKDIVIQGSVLPDDFPFEIIDNPGEETIILNRTFGPERIEVLVGDFFFDENGVEVNDKESTEYMHLTVTVIKGDGPRLKLWCNASPDNIHIYYMEMEPPKDPSKDDQSDKKPYTAPNFSDLDENLQKEFQEYLERRGIKSSFMNSLKKYWINKDKNKFARWLGNMKEFVEK